MTEKEMRESEVPRIKDIDELKEYIQNLVNQEHDYGTCVYAMSMAATATFNYVASALGVTAFQASCADLDILRRTRSLKSGFMIIDYDKLLYPQYCNSEHFPDHNDLILKNREMLAKKSTELLKSKEDAHPNVIAHWKYLAGLVKGGKV